MKNKLLWVQQWFKKCIGLCCESPSEPAPASLEFTDEELKKIAEENKHIKECYLNNPRA